MVEDEHDDMNEKILRFRIITVFFILHSPFTTAQLVLYCGKRLYCTSMGETPNDRSLHYMSYHTIEVSSFWYGDHIGAPLLCAGCVVTMASFRPSDSWPPLQEGNDSSQSSSSNPMSQSRTSAHVVFSSSSVADHPLLPPPASSAMSMDLELSDRSSTAVPSRDPLPSSYYSAAPHPALPHSLIPPPVSAPHFPPPPQGRIASSPGSDGVVAAAAAPATLDDLADAFLSKQHEHDTSLSSSSVQPPQWQQQQPPLLRPLPLRDFDNDLDKLRALAERRAWADVVALANQLLRASSSHYATLYSSILLRPSSSSYSTTNNALLTLESQQVELVEILSWQCQGLLKMRRYSELKHEVDQWSFCAHHHIVSPDVQPLPIPWIPWSLHILAATALVYAAASTNSTATATGPPSDETGGTRTTTTDAADALWWIRTRIPSDDLVSRLMVEQALSNVFVQRRQWRMALKCLQSAMDLLPAAVLEQQQQQRHHHQPRTSVDCPPTARWEAAYRCELLSCQGRILLQVGALSEASEIFQQTKSTWKDVVEDNDDVLDKNASSTAHSSSSPWLLVRKIPIQLLVNDGLLSFAYGHFDRALEYFRQAIVQIRTLQSQCTTALTPLRRREKAIFPRELLLGVSTLEDLYSETCNNMSLCAVYTCRLPEAVHVMESLVREDPGSYLTDRVALNLWYVTSPWMTRTNAMNEYDLVPHSCDLSSLTLTTVNSTLYELGSEPAASSRKKRVLQVIAKRFFLHDIGPESFRLG